MLQFDEYKVKINNLKPDLEKLGQALDLESAERELDMLHAESAADGFWDNVEKARKIQQRISQLEDKVSAQQKRLNALEDLLVLCEMGNEEDDESLVPEVEEGYENLIQNMETARLETLLSGEYDDNPAIVSPSRRAPAAPRPRTGPRCSTACIPAGRSATASPTQILDYQDGDEAGIKSAAIAHRGGATPTAISRASTASTAWSGCLPSMPTPAGRPPSPRWRSCPRSTTDIEVDIRPEDIEMQVYRSSGAGGQHINKTSSAVRLIHKPTGIVVACQQERSQFQNKDNCMKMLRAKLVELKEQEHAGEDLRHQGRPAEDRVGQPDPLLRVHALPAGEGQPHRPTRPATSTPSWTAIWTASSTPTSPRWPRATGPRSKSKHSKHPVMTSSRGVFSS